MAEEQREQSWVREDWAHASVQRRILQEPRGLSLLAANDPDMRIILGIPMERTISQHAFFGFSEILIQGWPLARLEYTRNDIARCKLADFMLSDDKFTHLLMLDSDHVHPPDVVQRLARWFRAYPEQVQVVGGLNFRRGAPYDPCAFIDPGDGKFRRLAEWPTGAMDVDALGTGSIMIARSVFEQMEKPYFAYNYDCPYGDWPGTDMWFSAECRKRGITLWCDTTTVSPHIGVNYIDASTYSDWVAGNLREEDYEHEGELDSAPEPISLGI